MPNELRALYRELLMENCSVLEFAITKTALKLYLLDEWAKGDLTWAFTLSVPIPETSSGA